MPQNMTATFREYMSLERRRSSEQEVSIAEYQRWLQLKRILNRHLQPGVLDAHEDRRESVRIPSRLRVGFKSYGNICESLMTNFSRGGVFVATPEPLPMNSLLELRLSIEESGKELDVQGEVASLNTQAKALDEMYELSLRQAISR
jgi:hypothetical protein